MPISGCARLTRRACADDSTGPRAAGRATVGFAVLAGALVAVAGCSSGSGSNGAANPGPSSPIPAVSGGQGGSPQVEVNPPGDIPDNQAYVPYAGSGFSVVVPEGWARTSQSGAVVFNDKYNSITITTASSPTAPTEASARSNDLPTISAASKGFEPGAVSTVHRSSGPVVLITYRALSAVNPITGKVAKEAVERYEFWRGGREVVLTLAAPVGADNVDPWRKVTDSFTWTGK